MSVAAVARDLALGAIPDAGDVHASRGGDDPLMVISLRVRVPVLSVQITDADPSASTELSFLTTALRFAMRCTPIARTTDRIVGSPSGTAATASETPSSRTMTKSLAR